MLNFNLVTSVADAVPKSAEGGHVSIVGKVKDGSLLLHRVVRQKKESVSVIDFYDVKQHTLTTLYRHFSELHISTCSTNESRTFLAVTTLTRVDEYGAPSEDPKDPYRYESHIITLVGEPTWVSFKLRSTEYHCMQFFGEEKTTFFGEEKIVAYFLFFLDQETIDMYQVQRKRSSNRVVTEEIKTQPELRSLFYKQLTWFEWDVENDLLYALTPQTSGKDDAARSYLLRCIRFSGSRRPERPESVMEIVLQMSLLQRPLPPPPPICVDPPAIRPLIASQRHSYLHVVRLRSNIVALCQQHVPVDPTAASSTNLAVTVYVFPDLFKLDFTISLVDVTPEQAARIRVFFGHIADMLLIYVPHQYMRLVDCSSEHEPCDSLTLGPDLVPGFMNSYIKHDDSDGHAISRWPLPEGPGQRADLGHQPVVIESFGNCPDMVDEIHLMDVPDNTGHCFLDYITGSIYEFSLSREAILHAFHGITHGSDGSRRGGPLTCEQTVDMLVQLLHLVVVHLQDLELADNIMRAICRRSANYLGVELAKEYLLAVSYQTLKTASDVDPHLVHTLPVSSLIPYASAHMLDHNAFSDRSTGSPQRISFAQYSPINGSYYAPGPHMKYPRSKTRNSLSELGYAAMNRAVSQASRSRTSTPNRNSLGGRKQTRDMPNDAGLRTFFQFLGLGDNDRAARTFQIDDDLRSLDTGGNRRFMSHLLEHLCTTYPKESRKKCGQLCETLSDIREAKSVEVYTLLASNLDYNRVSDELNASALFDVYMALYCALEELAFPIPHNLKTRLAELGLSSLSRSLYLQYVERGVFAITETLVKRVSANMGITDADANFMHHLVRRLDADAAALEILEDHVRDGRHIAEYIVATEPDFERKLLAEPDLDPFGDSDNMYYDNGFGSDSAGDNDRSKANEYVHDNDDDADGSTSQSGGADGEGDTGSEDGGRSGRSRRQRKKRKAGKDQYPDRRPSQSSNRGRHMLHSERAEFAPAHAFISLFEHHPGEGGPSAFVDYVLSHVSEAASVYRRRGSAMSDSQLDSDFGSLTDLHHKGDTKRKVSTGPQDSSGRSIPSLSRIPNEEIDFDPVSPSKALAGNAADPRTPRHRQAADSIQMPASLQLRMSAPAHKSSGDSQANAPSATAPGPSGRWGSKGNKSMYITDDHDVTEEDSEKATRTIIGTSQQYHTGESDVAFPPP